MKSDMKVVLINLRIGGKEYGMDLPWHPRPMPTMEMMEQMIKERKKDGKDITHSQWSSSATSRFRRFITTTGEMFFISSIFINPPFDLLSGCLIILPGCRTLEMRRGMMGIMIIFPKHRHAIRSSHSSSIPRHDRIASMNYPLIPQSLPSSLLSFPTRDQLLHHPSLQIWYQNHTKCQ